MNSIEKSETFLEPPIESDGGELLLDAWRICLAEALERQQRAWQRHVEFMEAKSAAIIGQLEAKIATLETRIQSRLDSIPAPEPGPVGPVGDIGPIGPEGPAGRAGEVGERGFRGEPGESGPRGERGSVGPVGLRGPRGIPGIKGARGDAGKAGRDGRDGKDGEPGERGNSGPVGLRGPRGLIGVRGERGEKGARGEQGKRGEHGQKGERGETGQPGEQGPVGEKGERGEAGVRGPQGEPGPVGPQGPQGERGYLGERGEAGLQGPQGQKGDPGSLPMIKQWRADAISYAGEVVFCDGGSWQAQKDTAQKPPHSDWMPLAHAGRSATSPVIRGTFDPAQQYGALNIVAMNGSSFIAKSDDPGECPGDGWQLIASAGRQGKPGPKGDRGEQGPAGVSLAGAEIERRSYTIKLKLSNGIVIAIPCREMFEQYHEESGDNG